jgi:hypothetical protein
MFDEDTFMIINKNANGIVILFGWKDVYVGCYNCAIKEINQFSKWSNKCNVHNL